MQDEKQLSPITIGFAHRLQCNLSPIVALLAISLLRMLQYVTCCDIWLAKPSSQSAGQAELQSYATVGCRLDDVSQRSQESQ